MTKKETKEEKLNSNHHTLFKTKIEVKEVKLTNNTYKKEPAYTKFRLFIERKSYSILSSVQISFE